MKPADLIPKILVVFTLIGLSYVARSQDFSAGINTETPNPNAVLHLVAPNGDQGFLIPALSTAQRTGMTLGAADNGLLVFDTGLGLFFYYSDLAGDWFSLDNNAIDDKITSATITGNTLTITEGGVDIVIDLSPFDSAPQDILTDATAGNLSISGGSTLTINVDDADADPVNEIQDIATDASAGNISIAGGSTLTLNVNDADADPANEIELPPTATIGEVLEWNGTAWVAAVDDGALPPGTVVGQVLEWDGTTWTPGTDDVDDADADPTNEIELPPTATIGEVLEWNGTAWVAAADDGLATVNTDITLAGDGTAGTPLTINRVNPNIIAGGGAVATQILKFNGTNWIPVADDIALADGATITGDGGGTPYAVNVGTGANQIVQLDAGGALPAVDGSALTGITPALGVGSVTTTEIADGTIATIDIANLAVTDAQINDVAVGKISGAPNLDLDNTDDLTTGNIGTGAGDLITLSAPGTLPTLDGSNLVNVPATIAANSITTTELAVNSVTTNEIVDGTIIDADINDVAVTKITGAPNLDTDATDDLTTVASDATLGGDGTVGTPLAVNVGTGANQIVQLDAGGALPAVDGSALTGITPALGVGSVGTAEIADGTIATIDIANLAVTDALINDVAVGKITGAPNLDTDATDDLTAVASDATLGGDGTVGTPLAVNVGTGANQIVQLDAGGALPAVDGSALTGITPALGVGSVGTAEIADGTIATIDIANLAVTDALINDVAVGKITGAPNLDTDATDDLTAVASDATLGGDGTVGTPLAVNVGTGANQIVQLDAGGALPAVDGSALTGITPALGVGSITTTEIADGTIADVDIAAGAAISGAKVDPNFGAQDIVARSIDIGPGLANIDNSGSGGFSNNVTVGNNLGVSGSITGSTLSVAAASMTVNASGDVVATSFSGDGSGLTGITPTIGAGSVTTTEIFDGTIATIDIANLAVTDALINDVAVGKITGAPNLDTDATDDLTTTDVGTGAGQLVALSAANTLPILDGSNLTGITVGVGSVTTTEILDGTIATIDIANLAVTDALINDVAVGKITGAPNLDTDATDDLTTTDVGTGAGQLVALSAANTLPILDGSNLTGITVGAGSVTTTEILDGTIATIDIANLAVTDAQINDVAVGKITGAPNLDTDATDDLTTTDVGTGAGQLVALSAANTLPILDGSNLTGITVGAGSVTTTEILDGTIATIDIANLAVTDAQINDVAVGKITGAPNLDTDATDDLTATDIGTGAGQLVALSAANTLPILDGSNLTGVMDVATYDPNTVADDAFAFGTHTSATAPNAGDVLTYNGVIWDAAPAGLSLPFSQTVTGTGADLFDVVNDGTGGAAAFQILNAGNVDAALTATTNGSGAAILATNTGTTGPAVTIDVTGAGNPGAGLALNHAGTGPGILLTTVGPLMNIPGGAAGEVLTSDASGNITLQPGGLSLPFNQTVTDGTDLFYLINDGTGGSGVFEVANLANAGNALSAITNGTGTAFRVLHTGTGVGTGIDVSMNQASASGPAIRVNHAGLGIPADFRLNNTTNTSPAISVFNQGVGQSLFAQNANASNVLPVIEVLNAGTGPDIRLPTGATAGYVLTSDALGNATWQPGGLTLPFTGSDAGATPLFTIENTGVGPAASFTNSGDGVALGISGNIAFSQGSDRILRIVPSTVGNGNNLQIIAGNAIAGGPADGGNLSLQSGSGTGVTGNGGNIRLEPGDGGASGNPGRVLIEGVTRIGNPRAGFGGALLLEDDGGTNAIAIRADPATTDYNMILPLANASGVLTNDGAGTLSWAPAGLTFPSSTVQADSDTLFNLTNPGSGPAAGFAASGTAATFRSFTNGTALLVEGNMEFLDGVNRDFGILPNLGGAGDLLNVYSGDAAGPGGNGGDLVLSSGLAAVTGDGGNILITPGAGAGGGFAGGVFIDAITSISNPNPGFGGILELVNDAETFAISIEAEPTMAADYTIILPGGQGSGALTNDGAGNLTWAPAAGAGFAIDGSDNIISSNTAASPGTGTDNFLAGFNAGANLTSGSNNIYVGSTAGFSTQDGILNVGVGANAGSGITSGQGNVMIGQDAGSSITTGTGNVIIGQGASSIDNSSPHVVIGQGAAADGVQAVAIGAGATASGDNSFALGPGATVTQDETAVIGDPTNPPRVGFGTNTPNARIQAVVSGATTLDVMNLTNDGDGRSLSINVVNATNTNPAVLLSQTSTGVGIDARITNVSSTATVITATHQGEGNVAFFNQGNTTSGGDAMFVQTAGLGAAGVFQINNTGSTVPALVVSTNGDDSNGILVNKAGVNGHGVSIDMNSTGTAALQIVNTNAGVPSISVDSDITTSGTANIGRNLVSSVISVGLNVPNTNRIVRIGGTGPVTFDNGVDGQELIVVCETGNPDIFNGGILRLDGSAPNPFNMAPGSSIHLVWMEPFTQWVEISRSQ